MTFRIPRELSRALNRSARERGVPKSQLVREALREYLVVEPSPEPGEVWRRIAKYKGIAALDHAAIDADPIARQIREHNWRD
ncbi:MAG: CopG family transcriptional regulator [Gemmatimonadales bacterium]